MVVYIVFFSFLVIGSLSVRKEKGLGFLFTSVVFLGLIIGLRDSSVGSDTLGYISDFNSFAKMSFPVMWKAAFAYKEPLYVIFSWILSSISHDYRVFLMGWALFPTISIYLVFRNRLESGYDYLFGFLVLFVLGFFAFFVAGIRQTAAISIILLSYKYLREKKLLLFILSIGLASMFHRSSFIFLLSYPILFLQKKWHYWVFFSVLFVFLSTYRLEGIFSFSQLIFEDLYSDKYSGAYESSQNNSALYMQALLLLLSLFKIRQLLKKDDSVKVLFVLAVLGLFFQIMAGQLAEMSRISFYFCISQIVLFPKVMREYSDWVQAGIVVLLLIYLFFLTSANLPVYHFSFS